jgi:four helix bundle protein
MKNEINDQSYAFALLVVDTYKNLASEKRMTAVVQFFKSGTSIGANYREAQFAQSRADFINKLSIARKECNECMFWIDILLALDLVDIHKHAELKQKCSSILRVLTAMIKTSKANGGK